MNKSVAVPDGIRGTPEKPDLTPQRAWFVISLVAFLGWIGALLALYFKETPQVQGF